MWARAARKLGLTLAEYEARRTERKEPKVWPSCRVYFITCSYCDKPFTAQRSNIKYCSDEHRKAANREAVLARYWENPDNWSTKRKRRRIFERDNWRCRVCGKAVLDTVAPTADNRAVAGHILAKSTGGEWTDENMCTLCYPCNADDGVNQIPIQFRLTGFEGGLFL